jgi:large subunit ribosomal protein L14
MIFKKSKLVVVDNSGAKIAKCINIVKRFKFASVCNLILVTLDKFIKGKRKVKKKLIYLGVLVATKYWSRRKDGFSIKFYQNKILIFNLQFKFLGTRIYGLINKDFKKKTLIYKDIKFFHKLISYSVSSV